MSTCIINIGLYRTGTTTLAEAAKLLGFKVYREFQALPPHILQLFLSGTTEEIDKILLKKIDELLDIVNDHDLVCDGWFPLLALASTNCLEVFKTKAEEKGINIILVSSGRIDFDSYLRSELHHWVRHDIERHTELDDRSNLERLLQSRYERHRNGVKNLKGDTVPLLDLSSIEKDWTTILSTITNYSETNWDRALSEVGKQNCSPQLPVQAVLLTMRIVDDFNQKLKNVSTLLNDIEKDHLCSYMVILAIDEDEDGSQEAMELRLFLEQRPRMKSFHYMTNPKRNKSEPVPICQIWHDMSACAWKDGASWVVFLGDDVRIKCNFHYRAIYRAFLDIQQNLKLNLPSGRMFGCPWFDDEGFKGFPTFPIVGNMHYDIFGGLIPEKHLRNSLFVNQDLDPYLQRLYLKFGSAPFLKNVTLSNSCGGSENGVARYNRVPATHWRDEVLNDISPIENHLRTHDCAVEDHIKIILDVIIPSYRVNITYLRRLCALQVPSDMRTTFIVIVDNPVQLIELVRKEELSTAQPKHLQPTHTEAEQILEQYLFEESNYRNNIRVRCNKKNLGASASRNRGIKESAAEYVLFLDDDVIPDEDILKEYGQALNDIDSNKDEQQQPILGLVGMVRFPRVKDMPMLHAGILFSYLTFMFEIADNSIYKEPAWGVTANILFRKFPGMSFDTGYAKTGGGEDVDFALRLHQKYGLNLKSCPRAKAYHPFWDGGLYFLCKHFFCWAMGDGALFDRFTHLSYHSFPNIVEMWLLLVLPCVLATNVGLYYVLAVTTTATTTATSITITTILMIMADIVIDMYWKWGKEFNHRRSLLVVAGPHEQQHEHEHQFSLPYAIVAHILANIYVIALECGRVYGHMRRGQVWNITRRFDWHCNRLPNSKENFIFREKIKFITFSVICIVCI